MKAINYRCRLNTFARIAFIGLALFTIHQVFHARVITASYATHNVIVVSTTIQAAIDSAEPGDTVIVPPNVYRENVLVTKDNITIQGSKGAVMDGTGLPGNTAIRVAAPSAGARINGFRLSGLTIQNYSRTGILLLRVDHFHVMRGVYIDNNEYGIFPILSSNGLIDFNEVSGSDDTGIYVGQSHDIVVEKNHTRDCTLGIAIENSSYIAVRENTAVENSIGIVVQLLPGLGVKVTSDVEVKENRLIRNNRPNPVTDPEDSLSLAPSGIGFLNVGGDRVRVERNVATQNNSGGIAVIRLPQQFAQLDSLINPLPDDNVIANNVALQNGRSPDPKISPLLGSDLVWDLSGANNCWSGNVFKTTFPVALPECE